MRHSYLWNKTVQREQAEPQVRLTRTLPMLAVAVAFLFLAPAADAVQSHSKPQAKGAQSQTTRNPSTARKAGDTKAQNEPDMTWLQDALKNPELMTEVGHLEERMVKELPYPATRNQSRILPYLPESTLFYAAFPNYVQTIHKAMQIWQEELRTSAPLRDFLKKQKADDAEATFEQGVQKISEVLDYLGDEVVITGGLKGKDAGGVLIAEIKKPGLKAALLQMDEEFNKKSSEHLRVFEPQELAAASELPAQGPVVLVRQDFVVAGISVASLREASAYLDSSGGSFASSALGKRLAQAYQSGTNTVAGADLQRLMGLIPDNPPQTRMMLEKTGFANVKYFALANKMAGGKSSNEVEIVFNGPRKGIASWIAAPGPMGALDFISARASVAEELRLKSLPLILDDVVDIVGPQALAMLPQMEARMNVNLKQDILSKLSGEIAFELQQPPMDAMQKPTGQGGAFKVVLGVSDPAGLQKTLKGLLAQARLQSEERIEDGVTFYSIASPSAPAAGPAPEFNYFFVDGYLVLASSREGARDALSLHRKGGSLAKSPLLAGAQGQPVKASVLAYQNSGPFLAAMMKNMSPDMAAALPKILGQNEPTPNLALGYADENSLRGTTNNNISTDASVGLMAALIALPALVRTRIDANDSAAAASLRTINTAEVTYLTSYPKKGYAPTLAVLGPPAGGECSESGVTAAHACLLDEKLGNATCTAGKWCEKSGYRFSVRGICTTTNCSGYVATATPAGDVPAGKSFCSVKDAVVRTHIGPPVKVPLTAAECRAWKPIE